MKKIILNTLLVLSIIFCCSCAIKQDLPISEGKYITEDAPFCLTSGLLLEYSLIVLRGDMSTETYYEYATFGCCVTNGNYPIKIIANSSGISKIKMINGAVTITGYTFNDFIYDY